MIFLLYLYGRRVTTCLENLEMSGSYTDVREMSGISLKVMEMSGNCQGENLVMENCPKTFIIASTGFLVALFYNFPL